MIIQPRTGGVVGTGEGASYATGETGVKQISLHCSPAGGMIFIERISGDISMGTVQELSPVEILDEAGEPLVIGPEMNGTLMTPQEFDETDPEDWDDRYRYELINGVLVVVPPASAGERASSDFLTRILWKYRDVHPQGAAMDYTLPEHTIKTKRNRRRADRVIWAGLGRMPNVHRDPPTIAAEFVSKRKRDRVRDYETKRDEYREIGISEYWVIDRFRRRMVVFRQPGTKPSELVLGEHDVYTTPLLPGFELPLARLFAELDNLEKAMQGDEDEEE